MAMDLEVSIEIDKSKEDVWKVICDIENSTEFIESISKIEVLENPKDTILGFKWKETRVMFGKEAIETMWITDYAENEYYQTRAESHGSIYISKLSVERVDNQTKLTMSFSAEGQSSFVKIISLCMGFLMKGFMKKALIKDLNDIKTYLESN